MVLASNPPLGVGVEWRHSVASRLARPTFVALSIHWVVATGLFVSFAHGWPSSGLALVSRPGSPMLLLLAVYALAFVLLMPLHAWGWMRSARAVVSSPRYRRWIPAATVALYGLQVAYYVPFLFGFDTVLD